MTSSELYKEYQWIIDHLDHSELKLAFEKLNKMIREHQAVTYLETISKLEETYKYMLIYFTQGSKDPERDLIYNNLRVSMYELADKVYHETQAQQSKHMYYIHKRRLEQEPISYTALADAITNASDLSDYEMIDNSLQTLFYKIWTSGLLSSDQATDIQALFDNESLHDKVASQIVSALYLGVQTYFDSTKVKLLFDIALSGNPEARIRAFIVLLLILDHYKQRIAVYPVIAERLMLLAEAPDFVRIIRTVILRFILSRETENITRKLREELIPEILKITPKINDKMNLMDLASDMEGDGMNPEWQDMLSKGKLGKQIEEFSELQQEGADIMHSTFAHLKGFPYFKEIPNWLLLYDKHFKEFVGPSSHPEEASLYDTLEKAPFLCNSDKFSLSFSLSNMPESARNMMLGQFSEQAGEFMQQMNTELPSDQKEIERIASQYIQDLYRFYKLYPFRSEFDDIFRLTLDFHNLPILRPYLSDDQTLLVIAEYYMRKNYLSDALPLFEELSKRNPEDDVLFQKIGYCKQMAGDMHGALDAYMHAEMLHPDSQWVLKRIAACYRSLKQPQQALEYYKRHEALAPDNLSIQLNIGHCYLELKEYDEALKCYFKVDYLDSKSHKAWRPIAWCSFLTGKFEQARNYYAKITSERPKMQDYLNAGHTEWAMQNTAEALNQYKLSVQQTEGGMDAFVKQFKQDIPDLIAAGIHEKDIPLILDRLYYIIEE